MKRLFATVLGLLLVWVQVCAMAQPTGDAVAVACRCCSCQQTDCCVSESSSTSQPVAATPLTSVQFNHPQFSAAASPAWLLPLGDADIFSAAFASPLCASRVPLFTRHCALLI